MAPTQDAGARANAPARLELARPGSARARRLRGDGLAAARRRRRATASTRRGRRLQSPSQPAAVDFQFGHTTDRRPSMRLGIESFDHVVVVCLLDSLDVQRADARTLVTLLHLRDIAEKHGRELLDRQRDARRAQPRTGRGDARRRLHRQRPAGQPDDLAARREQSTSTPSSSDLFDPAGSEIYLRPASDYVAARAAVDFYTIVEAARRRGEVAIGYRRGDKVPGTAMAWRSIRPSASAASSRRTTRSSSWRRTDRWPSTRVG